ncbi:MAG: hypothetical protein CSA96_04040 [Bacteroidetes bacterium]|nr:MAG: hypothetical protein CSA96_04040 [Bacteroidota bacterium]
MKPIRYLALSLLLSPYLGMSQDCTILSKENAILPDKLCAPVTVTWTVNYTGVNDAGTTVEIHFDWDDGNSQTETAVEIDAGASKWQAIATHTYLSINNKCNYRPVATLVVNGTMCSSSSQEQIVTVWDTDNDNGGHVNASPDVYPICVGSGATMHFDDNTLFNCVPPQENDVPNKETRWIQWVYGTANSMSGTPVTVGGVARTYPYTGPVIELPGPVTGSNKISETIWVDDDKLVGQEFEVELRYWNYCNPYPGPYKSDRSVIRIVDFPDATINPIAPQCHYGPSVFLSAATAGGNWSGPGIINGSTGEFLPSAAGPGNHTITYEVASGNGCTSTDTEVIQVIPSPDGRITPTDPFCLNDAPYDLEAAADSGTWSGFGITNTREGIFDPVLAGLGRHPVSFRTDPDANGCFGVDTTYLYVVDQPFAEILSEDSAWCEVTNNQSFAEVMITGTDSTSFDLVFDRNGSIDTVRNLPAGLVSVPLYNQSGSNRYILLKVIEHHGNNSCETSLHDTLVMDVYDFPGMELDLSEKQGCSPLEITLTAPPGYNKYIWNFGDGTTDETNSNTRGHVYSFSYEDNILSISGGDTIYDLSRHDTTYIVRLVVESIHGCTGTVYDTLTVYPSPRAAFVASPPAQYFPSDTVSIYNYSSVGPWDYLWDFGDGQTDTERDVDQHIYDSYGSYDIRLRVSSPHCADSLTRGIQIFPPAPVAGFQPDSIGCPPLVIHFRNNSQYADTYVWDFDDGSYSSEPNPSHTFWASKEHHVKLAAFGPSGSDTTEQIVSIYEKPQALFQAYPTEARNLKQSFKFINNSNDASYYLWDFGDGHTTAEESPEHIYGEEGVYTVRLIAWSENDCPDTLIVENLITVIAGEGSVEFPNAFVWNGEGPDGGYWTDGYPTNHIFRPVAVNVVKFSMIIYNRWGEKVFETNELYKGWDGYLESGELASQGVYVYKAFVTYVDGTEEVLTGDLTFLNKFDPAN